ncbi:MAG: DeoR/GlpR family DNA-binding transcription regulator [Opitutaceae bacterium]|nr:DeoR/GlpR family DNA-binding transcription regulator [Opitutaceae bacterium]
MEHKRREEEILRYLENHEFLTTEKAIKLLGDSAATVRRAFVNLARSNLVQREHGGVRAFPKGGGNLPFSLRESWLGDEKERLAARAMEFVPVGGVVFIHGGSTVLGLARYLRGGVIITDTIHVCEILMKRFPNGGGPEVILPGGVFDLKSDILVGPRAEAGIRDYRADVVFFSARGMDEEGPLDTTDTHVATARAMIRNAGMRVMLADHSKFRKFGLTRMASWKEINVLITSDHPDNRPWFKLIEENGVKVVLA